MIDISVIMPVFNEEKYIKSAIDSILSQSITNFEFIIIDDASTDKSLQIINTYVDSRIILIENKYNIGNYASRNKGLKVACGQYICIMDADDIAYPQRFEIQYAYLEKNLSISALGTFYDYQKEGNTRFSLFSHEEIMIALLYNNCILHSSLMIRSSMMKKCKGYDEKFYYSSDYDLMCRISLMGKIEILPKSLMFYRWHESQISQSHKKEQAVYANEIRQKYLFNFIERYKLPNLPKPDKWMIAHPLMGQIIAIFTYSYYTHKKKYEQYAYRLLDDLLENLELDHLYELEENLCYIGCGIMYILRNRFAVGDENEVLEDIDNYLFVNYLKGSEIQKTVLLGWIHYLTLRLAEIDEYKNLYCKLTLIHFIDILHNIDILDEWSIVDIKKLDNLMLFPERTNSLLNFKKKSKDSHHIITQLTNKSVAFIIPIRIDSSARERNIDLLLEYLSKRANVEILILEADTGPMYKMKTNYSNVKYYFTKDENPIFHRTKYINILLKKVQSAIVGVWDPDILLNEDSVDSSIAEIQNGRVVLSIPYDKSYICNILNSYLYRQRYLNISSFETDSELIIKDVCSARVFFVNKDLYLRCGGENEQLLGSMIEEQERIHRMEILGFSISRISGIMYILNHVHNTSIRFYSESLELDNIREYLFVCSLSKEKLLEYVNSWTKKTLDFENRIYLSINYYTHNMKFPEDVTISSPFLNNYFCIIKEYKIAYVMIAKNAVTHLKNITIGCKYGFYPDDDEVHSVLGFNDLSFSLCHVSKMKEWEKEHGAVIKFAVWRDPVERLVSCYKYFSLERADHFYYKLLGVYENNSFEHFMSIVRLELSKKDPLYQDEHLRRQSDYYKIEDVDYIVSIDKVNIFLEQHHVPVIKNSANETSVKFKLVDPDIIAEIKDLYKSDYALLPNY